MTTNYKIQGSNFEDYLIPRSLFADSPGLWTWGYNSAGQLGDNSLVKKSSPVQTVAGGLNWLLVETSSYTTTVAVTTDGRAWLWGYGSSGQLGDNTAVSKTSPVQTISGGTNWKQLSVAGSHTLAIKTDGTLWSFGSNSNGRLGDNTTTNRSSPVQTVAAGGMWKQVSAGEPQSAAIKTDGTLWLWGYNAYGQLGDNTIVQKSSPIQTIAGGTDWKLVASSESHCVHAIKTDGTLWSWGMNYSGVMGDNTSTHRSSPVQTISGGTNWKQVSGGYRHAAAVKTDGTLWLWGLNQYGQLGNNTTTPNQISSPVQTIAGGTNWKQVSLGRSHSTAIKTDGTLWAWGNNVNGQLGDNTVVKRSSPVQTVAGGTTWLRVSAGYHQTIAITS